MTYASKAWSYMTRICRTMHTDPEEMYQKGRRFLRYYRDTCCVPEYALVPEPAGSSLRVRRAFLDEMDAICGAGAREMEVLLADSCLSPMQMRHLVSETVTRLNNVGGNGALYWEIVTRKYLAVFPMTDAEIQDLMTISDSYYYSRHREACAYYMLTMANKVLPRMREELLLAEAEERLQPREVML